MSVAAMNRGLAYEVRSQMVGGVPRPHAMAVCQRCAHERGFRLRGEKNNPEAVQKWFRAEGWQFDAWKPAATRCPACVAAAVNHRRGESPKPLGGESMPRDSESPPGGGALPPDKTVLTAAERGRLRTLLDGVFDADKGYYIEAYSDLKVAAETDLPARLVREYREVAFGPLTAVPELDGLAADLRSLHERSAAQLAEATAIGAQVEALRVRLEETARRLGVGA